MELQSVIYLCLFDSHKVMMMTTLCSYWCALLWCFCWHDASARGLNSFFAAMKTVAMLMTMTYHGCGFDYCAVVAATKNVEKCQHFNQKAWDWQAIFEGLVVWLHILRLSTFRLTCCWWCCNWRFVWICCWFCCCCNWCWMFWLVLDCWSYSKKENSSFVSQSDHITCIIIK